MIHGTFRTALAGSVVVALFLAFGACRQGLPDPETHTITIQAEDFEVRPALIAETTSVAFATYPVGAITETDLNNGNVRAQLQDPENPTSWEPIPHTLHASLSSGRTISGTLTVEYYVGSVRVRVQSNVTIEDMELALPFYNDYKIRIRIAG